MKKSQLAKQYFEAGANCAQAVLCAFAQECGLTSGDAMRIASGFGGGMGRMREICGAVSGMTLVANLLYGNTDPADKAAKDRHYALIQQLAKSFQEQNGSIICRELLHLDQTGSDIPVSEERTREYYRKRPCAELVEMAAQIVEQQLFPESGDQSCK